MSICAVCSTPVRRARSGPTLCGARACRRNWLGADLRAGERRERARAQVEVERLAASINESRAASGSRRLPLAVLPSNDHVTAALPRELRERFALKLAPKIAQAMTRAVRPAAADGPTEPTARDALLGAACATCRGECCIGGTDHAHLDVDSLARVRAAHGWESDEDVMDAYLAHVPKVHYKHSCVFHGVRGCTLPRDMRADICNRHLCGALAQLTRAIDAGADAPFLAIAAGWSAPQRAAVISATEFLPVPLRAGSLP